MEERIKTILELIDEDLKSELITEEKAEWLRGEVKKYSDGIITLKQLESSFQVPF